MVRRIFVPFHPESGRVVEQVRPGKDGKAEQLEVVRIKRQREINRIEEPADCVARKPVNQVEPERHALVVQKRNVSREELFVERPMHVFEDGRIRALKPELDAARNARERPGKLTVDEFGARLEIEEHSRRLLLYYAEHTQGALLARVVSRVEDKNLRDFLSREKLDFLLKALHREVRYFLLALALITVRAFERAPARKLPQRAPVPGRVERSVEIRRRCRFRTARSRADDGRIGGRILPAPEQDAGNRDVARELDGRRPGKKRRAQFGDGNLAGPRDSKIERAESARGSGDLGATRDADDGRDEALELGRDAIENRMVPDVDRKADGRRWMKSWTRVCDK